MTGVVAGIGARAIFGGIAGKVTSGVGAAFKWVASLDLVHFLLLVAVLFGAWQTVGRTMQHRYTVKVEGQLSSALKARDAARASLATSQANEKLLRAQIATQNAAVASLGQKSAQQQKAAQAAIGAAAGRADAATEVANALSASAGLKTAPVANCEPSDLLKSQWK